MLSGWGNGGKDETEDARMDMCMDTRRGRGGWGGGPVISVLTGRVNMQEFKMQLPLPVQL